MADTLKEEGKVQAMTGIKTAIGSILLMSSATTIDTVSVSSSDFAVSGSGQLSNTSAINFTVASGDVGYVVDSVRIYGATNPLLYIDLETSVTLTTAGTASIAIGALTADL